MIRVWEQSVSWKVVVTSAPGFLQFSFRLVDSKASVGASFSPFFPSAVRVARAGPGGAGGAPRSTINAWTHRRGFRPAIAGAKRRADPPTAHNLFYLKCAALAGC